MSELFDNLPESKSPRLLWMERHGVSTRLNQSMMGSEGAYEAWTGEFESAVLDVAENGDYSKRMAYGLTDVHAMINLANVNGWKLWNEEGVEE